MRKYESLRRATQAAQTRSEIAAAARRLFVARGWAATTVRDVAREAGVSVPTVYAAYGNKTGLVQALAEAADNAAGPEQSLAEIEAAADDPVRQLAAMTGYDRRLYENAGDLILLVREAGRTEPALADAYREGRRGGDQTRRQVFDSWPLRSGLDLETAVDIYAAICNVDVYTTLTTERGWPPARVEQWWTETLARELL
ncbi:TetR/AcrR family transcriptional regulator [Actinoplanes sp. NBC_00393]|uniref:TetR/AcrR family transcriptional regulator n=1 Tax=Actinoplanes sp. NBC_00393 TaxID=2975953 RepID=UPI002E2459A3